MKSDTNSTLGSYAGTAPLSESPTQASAMISTTTFRSDINGLRAWAVVAVVLFHFGVAGFWGGFVGVDIFFVISGFLMTGIIVGGLEKAASEPDARPFSLIGFYLSRARRIIPALIALCLVLLAAGWFVLPAVEYHLLGKHVLSALTFVSNVVFWREDGYFDTASHDKLLLHTWSLSVEWQFYLLLPLVLVLLWKLRPGRPTQTFAIAAVLLMSLGLCVVATPFKPTAAFYLLPTRAWELLAGGLVYLLANPLPLALNVRRALNAAGFALMIGAMVLFDSNSPWPGWRATVPVLGAVLVLVAAQPQSIWTRTRPAQWLGECSYSIYLWHWPLVVALAYLQLENSPVAIIVALALTLVLGGLSYRFVEQPMRHYLTGLPKSLGAVTVLAASLALMVPALVVVLNKGLPGRLPAEIDAIFAESENKNPRQGECLQNETSTVPGCTYGGKKLGVIVVGDSHAAALIRGVERALPSPDEHVLDWTMSNCPSIANVRAMHQLNYQCGTFIAKQSADLDPSLGKAPLLIINRMSSYLLGPNEPDRTREIEVPYLYLDHPYERRSPAYLASMREGIINTACAFAQHRPVYMLRPIPELKYDVPKTMGRALIQGEHVRVSISLEEYHQRNDFVWQTQDMAAERCGVKILDLLPYLCHDGYCYGDVNGQPVYVDDDHLSERGGDLLRPLFSQMFSDNPPPATP